MNYLGPTSPTDGSEQQQKKTPMRASQTCPIYIPLTERVRALQGLNPYRAFLEKPGSSLFQNRPHSYQIILPTGPLPRVSFLLTKLWLLSLPCILTLDSVPKAAHQSLCTFVSPLPFAPGSSLSFSSTCPLSWCCSGKCIFSHGVFSNIL